MVQREERVGLDSAQVPPLVQGQGLQVLLESEEEVQQVHMEQ